MSNPTLQACPGCLRPAAETREHHRRCDDPANGALGRCLWRVHQAAVRAAGAPAAPAAVPADPADPAAELARERQERAALRERLRTTEALAAESHALRARMAAELERMTGELDRLRATSTATATATAAAADAAPGPAVGPSAPPASARTPPSPPPPSARTAPSPPPAARPRIPWLALGLLAGLAVGVAAVAGYRLLSAGTSLDFARAEPGPPPAVAPSAAPAALPLSSSPAAILARAASAVAATAARRSALAEQPVAASALVLPAQPPAAARPVPADLQSRLQAALGAEGVSAATRVDTGRGRVDVSDPDADNATRDRTDTVIRAVFAGANLPEPQIEHRWLSVRRPDRRPSGADAAELALMQAPAAAGVARQVASAPPRRAIGAALGDDPPVSLPAGRLLLGCSASASGIRGGAHRAAAVSACMNRACCSAANRQTEECRAFERRHPLTCPAG